MAEHIYHASLQSKLSSGYLSPNVFLIPLLSASSRRVWQNVPVIALTHLSQMILKVKD